MERNLDNPAGRIRYWLDALVAKPASDPLILAAADILEVDDNTVSGRADVMRLGVALADLCVEVRDEVGKLPEFLFPDILLADFGQIENAVDTFTMARHQKVENLALQIDSAGHRGLEMIDLHLHRQRPQAWIQEPDRVALIEQVRALVIEVRSTNELDQESKEFILVRLAAVEKALLNAILAGTPSIELATEALFGAVRRQPDMWDRIAGTTIAKRLGKLASALCMALGAVGGAPALMPGEGPGPEVTNIQIQVGQTDLDNTAGDETGASDDGIIDAELVDQDGN